MSLAPRAEEGEDEDGEGKGKKPKAKRKHRHQKHVNGTKQHFCGRRKKCKYDFFLLSSFHSENFSGFADVIYKYVKIG